MSQIPTSKTALCGCLPEEEGHLLNFWLPILATAYGSEAVAQSPDRGQAEKHPSPHQG